MKTILTVDDSPTIRQMTSLVLQSAGYQVIEAVDGNDALAKLTGKEVDLVLTDINMPTMDGIELTRRLRAMPAYRFVPIVMLTTESETAKRQEARAAGATAWIVKPFRPEQLVNVVQKVLG